MAPITISITNEFIRAHASPESMRRGQEYYFGGRVDSLALRDDILTATVRGSDIEPYTVRAIVRDGAFVNVSCTCPYDWGDWCKHIVAVALAIAEHPDSVDELPSLRTRLESLDRETLLSLVTRLVKDEPAIEAPVERFLTQTEIHSHPAQPAPVVHVDTESIKRRVHAAVHSLDRMRRSEAYWHVGGVAGEIRAELDTARAAIEQGQGRLALEIIQAVMEPYVEDWTWLDDSDGEASSVFWEIGNLLAEALLDFDLSPDERSDWADRIDEWIAALSEYGVDDPLMDAWAAARHGWDSQWLTPPDAGDLTDDDDAIDDDWESPELEAIRTRVLARSGRTEEALEFAAATGQNATYATILARSGNHDAATIWAIEHLTRAGDAFIVAKELDTLGARANALRVADHGLKLPATSGWTAYVDDPEARKPIHAQLGTWLRERAEADGEMEIARRAAMAALTAWPTLDSWLAASRLHDDWNKRREAVLQQIRGGPAAYGAGRVDIFLREGLIDDAIAVVSGGQWYGGYGLLARVAQAAIETRPEWIIATSKRQADEIMDRGDAAHYDIAVQWLGRARAAAIARGKMAEWQDYLDQITTTHRRKYKLMRLLGPLTTS